MNKLTPYELSISEQLAHLPMPPEDRGWMEMKKLLEEDDDDGALLPPPPKRGCAGLGFVLVLLLAIGTYFLKPQNWFAKSNNSEADVTQRKSLSTTHNSGTSNTDSTISAPKDLKDKQALNFENDTTHRIQSLGSNDPRLINRGTDSNLSHVSQQQRDTKGKSNVKLLTPQTSEASQIPDLPNQLNKSKVSNKTKSGSGIKAVATNKTTGLSKPGSNPIGRTYKNKNVSNNAGDPDVENRNKKSFTSDPKSNITILKPELENELEDSVPLNNSTANIDVESAEVVEISRTKDSVHAKKDSSNIVKRATDSVSTKKQDDKKKIYHFGLGLAVNQGLPLNGAKAVAIDYLGRKKTLTDYIPSFYARLYREEKWFIQSEFRYGAPQYIKEFVYKSKVDQDTGFQSPRFTSTYLLKKTYYHQVPLSFNYLVREGWSVGIGIIYNRFSGGISEETVRRSFPGTVNDTVISFKVINDKKDSSFVKNSFQWLFETQYKWRRLSFGARYAQGINPYIKYIDPVSNQPLSKKNNSLHLFLRFEFWNSRKKMVGYRN